MHDPGSVERFGALIAPVEVGDFVAATAAGKRLLLRGEAPRFATLLDWPAVNAILDSDRLAVEEQHADVRLFRHGVAISSRFWFAPFPRPRINPTALCDLLRQGATLIINGIHGMHPPLLRLRNDLSVILRARVWINAYLTFGPGFGFDPHFDDHDVIVAQVSGAKYWRLYDQPEHLPTPETVAEWGKLDRTVDMPVEEFPLNSGDLLFVPRGEWHGAHNVGAGEVPSVHLTIGVQPVRGVDLVHALRRRAIGNPLFRQDAPRLAGERAAGEHLHELKQALHALVAEIDLADLVPNARTGNVSRLDFERHGQELKDISLGADRVGPPHFHLPDLRR
ncbi:MAG: cupin domain-containing protein [Azospirillaceae bacterium]|nr:cupin domain-containing protein [Azospirillaceae bacterium]